MTGSFLATCFIYLPVFVFAWATIPEAGYKAAGQTATVSLSFAQISGGGAPAAEAAPEPEPEPETVEEPQPEPEKTEVIPEKIEKPKPKKKPEQEKPKPKKDKPKAKPKENPQKKAEQPNPQPAGESLAPSPVENATPGAPTAGSEGGISTIVFGEREDPFLSEVKRRVESVLHYPHKARAMRMEGTAVVQFIVKSDGTLAELELYKSSGYPLLDKMATKAVADAQPLWGKPRGIVRLRFPIRFELRR